jgi:tRNA (guanine-N7-)-methyltransferase
MQPKHLKFPYMWEERCPVIHDGVLFIPDYYDKHREWEFPSWEALFGNSNPVVVEYCSGNGTWIAEKARDKTKNWVAVEWRFERVQKIWSKKKNQKLDNLFIICGDARIFILDYLKDQSVDGVFVNFPDPWPKEKHAKNRLFQPSFINELTRTVKNGAPFIVATDDPSYGQQLTDVVLAKGAWTPAYPPPYFVSEWQGYGASYFDALWREKGRAIRYFQFTKNLVLPASTQSDLNWSEELKKIPEERVLIEFNFGWNQGAFFVNDPVAFQSYVLALDLFSKEVWPQIKNRCAGVVLHRGPLSILSSLVIAEGDLTALEAATVLGTYLHRLASFLPDEATVYCFFENYTGYTRGQVAQLLSRDRFSHIELSLTPSTAPLGILLPPDNLCSPEVLQALTELLGESPDLRVIPEKLLNEMWNDLDELVVLEGAVTPQGKRQLLGFEAAGGKIRSRGI